MPKEKPKSEIKKLHVYLHKNAAGIVRWVFDAPEHGLDKEPFVEGMPDIIFNVLYTEGMMFSAIKDGFWITFSDAMFKPAKGHSLHILHRQHERDHGWVYTYLGGLDGWLCPALFAYFDEAPQAIFFAAQAVTL